MLRRWLATFFSALLGGAAVVVGVWGTWLLVDPAEGRHYEYAIPGLVLAAAGAFTAVVLWRRA